MTDKFYITTTIPYANAPPHIGFALEIAQADALARWNTIKGNEVFSPSESYFKDQMDNNKLSVFQNWSAITLFEILLP